MTVADYLKQIPDQPVYFTSPADMMRVVGIVTDGRCLPFVRCVGQSGALVEWAVLYSTGLEQLEDCLDCGHLHELCCVCDDPLGCNDAGIDGDFVCDACVHYEVAHQPPMSWSINGRNYCE